MCTPIQTVAYHREFSCGRSAFDSLRRTSYTQGARNDTVWCLGANVPCRYVHAIDGAWRKLLHNWTRCTTRGSEYRGSPLTGFNAPCAASLHDATPCAREGAAMSRIVYRNRGHRKRMAWQNSGDACGRELGDGSREGRICYR